MVDAAVGPASPTSPPQPRSRNRCPGTAARNRRRFTLRQTDVQLALYGRTVPTISDVLPSWRLDWLVITDPEVIATSGSDRHPILRSGSPDDSVSGAYLELNDDELNATDVYEVDEYIRRVVVLDSGVEAFVYVAAD